MNLTLEEAWEFAEDAVRKREWHRLLIACDALEENGETEVVEGLRWYARKGHTEWDFASYAHSTFFSCYYSRFSEEALFRQQVFTKAADLLTAEYKRLKELFSD